jgi:hypothetical protein
MAIIQDGAELFGIETVEFDDLIVESFSLTTPANRVDLDDGTGEPLGSTIVPQRQEVSLTVQLGATGAAPVLGDIIPYDTLNVRLTSVDLTETQADYRRYSLSGYISLTNT